MYDEPYRWVEAVGNRRQYLDDQFRHGSPLVALSYSDGIVLLTISHGTPKLYEIYDRIGLGGMGHPADLEKLRFSILDMAHVEGFQRSPADVTAARLVKYGLAPVIKQAFEEIFKAPFITKLLLAELGETPDQDRFFTLDYDGTFEEQPDLAVLAATGANRHAMQDYLKQYLASSDGSLGAMVNAAIRAWALGSLSQKYVEMDDPLPPSEENSTTPTGESVTEEELLGHVHSALAEKTLECAILERHAPGSSTYRPVGQEELLALLPWLSHTAP